MRAKIAASVASAGVLAAGWAVSTANGQTLTTASGTTATSGTTTSGTTTSGTTTTGSTRTTSGSTTSAKSGSSTTYKDGTYTGTTASHRYGSVTVTVKISGGKISDVTANAQSDGDRHSDNINSQALPIIKSRVIAANSASVSTVSGATFTTGAYLTSLQSALSKAA